MDNILYDYCIVGAGPSGLTAAYKLLKGKQRVLLLERNDRVGGLAKSHNYNGQIFDTGPKRFHSDDKVVLDFIQEITRGDISRIGRSTKVHFLGKYFEWPLQSKDIFKMPLHVSFKCFLDLIKERKIKDKSSFHEYINSKYGETLYKIFFEPYTNKFLRWDAEDIHSDWASTGINRTVIDKRVNANTLFDMVQSVLLPAKIETEFLYPNRGGFGGFYENILSQCQAQEGFELLLSEKIMKLEDNGREFGALTTGGKALKFKNLIWSGNLNDLCELISMPRSLFYLNTIFYNIICKAEGMRNEKAQWIYVSKGDSLVSRITCMKEFAAYTCKEGYYNVMCELTDSQVKPFYFYNPPQYTQAILQELVSMAFLKDARHVEDIKINPVVDTYPIYHKRYTKDFGSVVASVKKFSKRIHLLGRSGAFWYNNSDHSIRFAIELVQRLLEKNETEFDFREYFGGTVDRAASPHGK